MPYVSTEIIKPGLTLLFVGFNPSPRSAETGFNYAGPNNRFYRILYESGLTNRLFEPSESPVLCDEYNYGFTNLVPRPTPRANDLSSSEYRDGAKRLAATLRTYQPKYACFVGKGVYQRFSRHKTVDWGFVEHNEPDIFTTFFVGPGTSGLVRMTLEQQISIYRNLAFRMR